MDKFLIVVDMQYDFIYGSLENEEAKKIVPNVKEKIEKYYKDGYKIIFTRDTHTDNYLETSEGKKLPVKHCVEGTEGWQIVDNLDKICDCKIINKKNFGYNSWQSVLDNPTEIVLIGVCTDICVVTNALILKTLFPDAKISVDASCCAGVTVDAHNAALATMKSCQIDVENE